MANRLGVSQATVLRAVARGILKPAETTPGGHYRFRRADVDAQAGAPSAKVRRGARLISTGEAARLLAVSQHTIVRACREGRLKPDETTPGGHRRFSEDKIRRLAPLTQELVGTGSAARFLGLSVDTLRRAVSRGAVTPAAVTPGGHRRFAAADLSNTTLRNRGGSHDNGNGIGHAST